jgi:hypothetical protein
MVPEPELEPLLADHDRPLSELGRELIAAANAAGGRDNITVILFALEEVDAPVDHARSEAAAVGGGSSDDDTKEYATFQGEAVPVPRQGVSRPPDLRASDRAEAEYRASATVALSALPARAEPIEQDEQAHAPPPRAPARKRRRVVTPGRVLALGCVLGLLAAFWLATRQVYFVGVDESRNDVVTVYHGLPYDLPLGIRLYSPVQHSGVTLQRVPPRRRETFTDHKLRSKDDAESLVRELEQGRIS